MNRRKFLRNGSLAGLALSATASFANDSTSNPDNVAADFDLQEMTSSEMQILMQHGKISSVDLVNKYLARIRSLDKAGPRLGAVIELNPDALTIAARMDAERKAGKLRGPLHGIPVLVKDNINTGDRMMTTAGALAMQGNMAREDAFIIKKLRAAGAVLMGKTNLSEWANFRSSRSTSGWSSRGGQTRCPYILDRNPSGSSSGTGAAVAANLCALGIGTETDGSIVSPSSVNGLVGIKPTVGLWSRTGIIPISATQDTAGPMARTVRDAAILLGALAEADPADSATAASTGKNAHDYTPYLNPEGLKGKRIGIESSHLKGHEELVGLYKKAIEVLKSKGAVIVEIDLLKKIGDLPNIGKSEFLVLAYEFKDGLNKYLAGATAPMKKLEDIIAFNQSNAARAMPYFKQETLVECAAKGDLSTPEYTAALSDTLASRKVISELLSAQQLDATVGYQRTGLLH